MDRSDKKLLQELKALGVRSASFLKGRIAAVEFHDPRITAEAEMQAAVAKTLDDGPADILRKAANLEDDNNLPEFERQREAKKLRDALLYGSS